jgi:hypothetical protein
MSLGDADMVVNPGWMRSLRDGVIGAFIVMAKE